MQHAFRIRWIVEYFLKFNEGDNCWQVFHYHTFNNYHTFNSPEVEDLSHRGALGAKPFWWILGFSDAVDAVDDHSIVDLCYDTDQANSVVVVCVG